LTSNEYGISLVTSSKDNNISSNDIIETVTAIEISQSSSNIITDNHMGGDRYGIYITDSTGNTVFHNRFDSNTYQVISLNSKNVWDNGSSSGGNYWSDYRSLHPDATELDSSGIWNTPYNINDNNQDNYPLVNS
jgi:parallel beta-helix repeat protein